MLNEIALVGLPTQGQTCWLGHGEIDTILTQCSTMSFSVEEHKIAASRHSKSQREFKAGRYLSKFLAARLLGGTYEDWQVTSVNQGVPQLLNGDGQATGTISISHSAGYIAVIINPNKTAVGVDVEHIKARNTPREVLSLICLPHEMAWYDEKPCLERFYRIWTAKEAIIKAQQLGIWDAKNLHSSLAFDVDSVKSLHNAYDMNHFQSHDATFMGTWAIAQQA